MAATQRPEDSDPERIVSLRVLGCNGFFPSHGRHTMSFLCRTSDGGALLLDAGSGVSRLAEQDIAATLRDTERLDIVLTHYHLDHVVGLPYLVDVWDRPIRLFAPAPPLVDAQPEDALSRLTGPPLFPVALEDFHHPVEVIAYDGDFHVGRLPVRTRRQQHAGGSVGLRFGDVVYTTDTRADPETAAFAQGADLLLHEVWIRAERAESDPRLVRGHTSDREAVRIAHEAGVRRFLPVHHHPRLDSEALDDWHVHLSGLLRADSAGASKTATPTLLHCVDGTLITVP